MMIFSKHGAKAPQFSDVTKRGDFVFKFIDTQNGTLYGQNPFFRL
jgi:hypothetical protein